MTSPDGTTGYIPRDSVAAAMQSGFKPTPSQVKQPGFFSTLADSLGVGPKSIQAAQEDQQAHPIRSAVEKYVPGAQLMPFARGAANQVSDTAGELWQAGKSLINGNPPEAALHGINSIPLVGRNIVQAGENLPPIQNGSYGDYLNETLKSPNAWGTAVGTAAQVAPLVLGAVDKADPGRPVIPNPPNPIPSKASAVAKFESLNQNLSNTPVTINAAAAPLQRATEIGVRGSTLPKAVNDILTRSQSAVPMTFPEARDYQMSLSDLSASDKLAMNNRMRGAVAQLNKGLFSDMRDTAETQGLGADYESAMKEYRQQAQIKQVLTYLGKAAIGTAGAGTLYELLKAAQK
jgi:hypothetical protein